MRAERRVWVAAFLVILAGVAGCADPASPPPVGVWDATVVVNGLTVPFTFEISGAGSALQGAFFDGERRVASTGAEYQDGRLLLRFDQYGAKVDVVAKEGRLDGVYDRGTRGAPYPFRAVPAATPPEPTPVPPVAGEWRVLLDRPSSMGEAAWRMVVTQTGARVAAAIMRVDGDTGTLSGSYKDGAFLLSHFSGARPTVLVMTPSPDGSMRLRQDGDTFMTAVRPTDARADAAPGPTDPTRHTTVADPAAKFRFSFPDLDGRTVSDTDARFSGKVVIVSVTGTWCPNCHDEAPFLAQLYRTYQSKGLEIVALAFEEPAQLKDLSRVRAFIRQYGITYPFLIAGAPEEASEKLPQAVNLTTFPATFVLGKDGRVRATHAGYASRATGEFYDRAQKAFMDEIDRLLAEG